MRTTILALAAVLFCTTAAFAQTDAKSEKKQTTTQNKPKDTKVKVETGVIETEYGTIEIEFYRTDAPKTVENFVQLAKQKYFDGIIIHRIVPGFVIQGGDPTGTGSGGKSIYGAKFEDEINKTSELYKTGYKRGIVAMANAGPNTNGSQFFICLKDVGLPPAYTIFGKVVKGMDAVDKIAAVKTGPNDKPLTPVVMKKVTVRED
jgi:cyclophilin family peptidyl-prolyl cis-trans isomerase